MKFLIIGPGNMGKRRAAHLRELGHEVMLMGREAGRVGTWPAVDGTFICTPPAMHWAYARLSVGLGLPTFIEKPLGLTGETHLWDALLREAQDRNVLVQTGYTLRHHEAATDLLSAVLENLPYAFHAVVAHDVAAWYPDYMRNHICLPQAQGGGVISELSHELDLALWLFGPPDRVQCVTGQAGWRNMQAEGMAAITLQWKGGLVGQIHLDCLSPQYRRHWTLYGDWVREVVFGQQAVSDALQAETESFCRVVEGEAIAMPSGEDGLAALRLIKKAQEAEEGVWNF